MRKAIAVVSLLIVAGIAAFFSTSYVSRGASAGILWIGNRPVCVVPGHSVVADESAALAGEDPARCSN
jgi:hypothetical protein